MAENVHSAAIPVSHSGVLQPWRVPSGSLIKLAQRGPNRTFLVREPRAGKMNRGAGAGSGSSLQD